MNPTDQQTCLNLWRELNGVHSELSVSYTSSGTTSPTVLVRPPITTISGPKNNVECWYLKVGAIVLVLYGAGTQSHRPSRCLLSPQVSLRALESLVLPPKMTIIPVADPVIHKAAEWYTRTGGTFVPQFSLAHEKGAFSTLKHHTSLTGSEPVFPPKTSR